MKLTFEKEECSRCGGTGRFSFNLLEGDRCRKCLGTGKQLTRAGAASRRKYEEWASRELTVPACEVQPGDTLDLDGRHRTVSAIYENVTPDHRSGNGPWDRFTNFRSVLKNGTIEIHGFLPSSMVRRIPTREQLRAIAPTLGRGATLIGG